MSKIKTFLTDSQPAYVLKILVNLSVNVHHVKYLHIKNPLTQIQQITLSKKRTDISPTLDKTLKTICSGSDHKIR